MTDFLRKERLCTGMQMFPRQDGTYIHPEGSGKFLKSWEKDLECFTERLYNVSCAEAKAFT